MNDFSVLRRSVTIRATINTTILSIKRIHTNVSTCPHVRRFHVVSISRSNRYASFSTRWREEKLSISIGLPPKKLGFNRDKSALSRSAFLDRFFADHPNFRSNRWTSQKKLSFFTANSPISNTIRRCFRERDRSREKPSAITSRNRRERRCIAGQGRDAS